MKKINIMTIALLLFATSCSQSPEDIYSDFCDCADKAIETGKNEFKECKEYIEKLDKLLSDEKITEKEHKEYLIKIESYGILKQGG